MVNFTLKLRENIYREWKDQYINYKLLKNLVKNKRKGIDISISKSSNKLNQIKQNEIAVEVSPLLSTKQSSSSSGNNIKDILNISLNHFEIDIEAFEITLEQELQKVERCYLEHLGHFVLQYHFLRYGKEKEENEYDTTTTNNNLNKMVYVRSPRLHYNDLWKYKNMPNKEKESLQSSLYDLYRMLNHLQNYTMLNYTGFMKILKKHDKLMSPYTKYYLKDKYIKKINEKYEFPDHLMVMNKINDIENFFSMIFCDKNISVARSMLTVKKEDFADWGNIYIGIKFGSSFVLLIWVIWDSLISPSFHNRRHPTIGLVRTKAYPVYRGIGGVLLLHWFWGLSLYVWHCARINYRYIFEFDPRVFKDYYKVFENATNFTVIYLLNILLYYKVLNGAFPDIISHGIYPLLLFIYTIYFYILQSSWKYKKMLGITLLKIISSPFCAVTLWDTFVADYLTSTLKINQDLAWSFCFFITGDFYINSKNENDYYRQLLLDDKRRLHHFSNDRYNNNNNNNTFISNYSNICGQNFYYVKIIVPTICVLPLWWRFQQNIRRIYDTDSWWPSLPNAIKYSLSQIVVIFGLFHPIYNTTQVNKVSTNNYIQIWYIVLFTTTSVYAWIWDVTMDWGLGRPEYNFLGDRQMFSRKSVYYLAIVSDLFLRFSWTLSLIPPSYELAGYSPLRNIGYYILPFTMVSELWRRTFWSFFRLENEHLRNIQGFRKIDFIPLHFDHDVGLLQNNTNKEKSNNNNINMNIDKDKIENNNNVKYGSYHNNDNNNKNTHLSPQLLRSVSKSQLFKTPSMYKTEEKPIDTSFFMEKDVFMLKIFGIVLITIVLSIVAIIVSKDNSNNVTYPLDNRNNNTNVTNDMMDIN